MCGGRACPWACVFCLFAAFGATAADQLRTGRRRPALGCAARETRRAWIGGSARGYQRGGRPVTTWQSVVAHRSFCRCGVRGRRPTVTARARAAPLARRKHDRIHPRELQSRFLEVFLAKDLDGLLSLYEDTAVFVSQGGENAVGTSGVREALAGLLGVAQTFSLTPTFAVEADGVALMHSDWSLEGRDPAGNPLSLSGTTVEVARRQKDGSWLYAVDSPFGAAE